VWSGSVAAFCERAGVLVATFYQWRRRLGRESRASAPPLFLPVRIAAPAQVEIDLPDGVRMRVPAQATVALEAVVAMLLGGVPRAPRSRRRLPCPRRDRVLRREHGPRQLIGYDETQTLEIIAPKLQVRVRRYPKYVCEKHAECGVTQPLREPSGPST
jgi:transposase-like protein